VAVVWVGVSFLTVPFVTGAAFVVVLEFGAACGAGVGCVVTGALATGAACSGVVVCFFSVPGVVSLAA
jgi:hypothetical protein